MIVILKENILKDDVERLLNIVRKYGVGMISDHFFELPDNVSVDDLNVLQKDKAIDKIVVKAYISEENIITTYAYINE